MKMPSSRRLVFAEITATKTSQVAMFCSMTVPPGIAGLEAPFVKPDIQAHDTEAGLQPLDSLAVLAGVANQNRGRLGGSRDCSSSRSGSRGLVWEGVPFLCELVHELDGIGHAKRLGLRAEIFQKVVRVDLRNDCSVGDKFARFVATIEASRRASRTKNRASQSGWALPIRSRRLVRSSSKRLARRTDMDSSWSFQISSVSSSMSALSGIPEILPKR